MPLFVFFQEMFEGILCKALLDILRTFTIFQDCLVLFGMVALDPQKLHGSGSTLWYGTSKTGGVIETLSARPFFFRIFDIRNTDGFHQVPLNYPVTCPFPRLSPIVSAVSSRTAAGF